jgi:hypothetical protein
MKMAAFRDIAPCSFVEVHSSPWWWRQYAPLKRRCTSKRLHGAVFQRVFIFKIYSTRGTVTYNLRTPVENHCPPTHAVSGGWGHLLTLTAHHKPVAAVSCAVRLPHCQVLATYCRPQSGSFSRWNTRSSLCLRSRWLPLRGTEPRHWTWRYWASAAGCSLSDSTESELRSENNFPCLLSSYFRTHGHPVLLP